MNKYQSSVLASIVALASTACGSDSDRDRKTIVINNEPLATSAIWEAPAYGWIFDVKDKEHTMYQVTDNSCQTFYLSDNYDYSHQELLDSMEVSVDKTRMTTTIIGLKVPGVEMTKISTLPDICVSGIEKTHRDSDYQFDAQRDLDIFWQTFNELYAFFELENIDWQAIYQFADSEIDADSTKEELFEVLAEMITPLKDFHVNLISEETDLEYTVSRKPDVSDILLQKFKHEFNISEPLTNEQLELFQAFYNQMHQLSYDVIFEHLVGETFIGSNNTETILWGKTPSNHGYVFIETMELEDIGDSTKNKQENMAILAETFDTILNDLTHIEGLIIDIRYNDGGDDFVGQYITSRLIDSPLHVYSKQARLGNERTQLQEIHVSPSEGEKFLGSIVLLTSNSTSSAAETFAISLRERSNTTLIGEQTAGGLSDMLPKTLPHGLTYTLSNEFYLTPDGESFEGTGVPVNIESAFFDDALFNEGIDNALDVAIEYLNAQQ